MVFSKNISVIEKKIGYTFKDKALLRQAFTRTSYTNEHKDAKTGLRYQSNEVLEFFGDSILSAAIVTLLMKDLSERYKFGISTTLNEGDFSNIKSKLSDKKNLSLATEKLGLQKFLLMGDGDAKLGIENEPSVMEDLFESIIGAIYIDSGNDIKAVISSLALMLDVENYLVSKAPPIQSFKNALQEWCADKNHRLTPPVYKTVSESGPDHKKIYERACYIGDKLYGIGKGKNQKLADAAAAEAALSALMEEAKKKKVLQNEAKLQNTLGKLKEYAQKSKKASPEFRDLGETDNSTANLREYEIECRFDGIKATGIASDKRTAKALAAERILKMIEANAKCEAKIKKARPVSNNKPKSKAPSPQKTKTVTPKKQTKRIAKRKPETK
ncbi:MAG: hypothetical protein E7612_05100 [Ruminococcaceae bacterium]|nr:hypothetical protein [Oscillospiraceae bacterium]